jgi:hypothetical protein
MTEKQTRVFVLINRKGTDPEEKARLLRRLEEDELTFELGVETAEAGISFQEWPYRCLSAEEFRRGVFSAAVVRDDLTISKDGVLTYKTVD